MGLTYKSAIEKLLAQPALACSWLFMLKFEFWQLWRRVIKLIAELHNSALDTLSQSGHLLLIQFENRSLVFQSLVDNFPGKVGFFFLFCRMGVVSRKGTEDRKKVGGANFISTQTSPFISGRRLIFVGHLWGLIFGLRSRFLSRTSFGGTSGGGSSSCWSPMSRQFPIQRTQNLILLPHHRFSFSILTPLGRYSYFFLKIWVSSVHTRSQQEDLKLSKLELYSFSTVRG